MSGTLVLRLEPVTTDAFGEHGHRQAPTALHLRQQCGAGAESSFTNSEPSLVLGRGGTTCIFDPDVPESLVQLNFDASTSSRGWVKATLMQNQASGVAAAAASSSSPSPSSPVQINGRPWVPKNTSSSNKRPHPGSDSTPASLEHRYLKQGDVISLLNGHYTYRVVIYRERPRSSSSPADFSAAMASLVQGSATQNATTWARARAQVPSPPSPIPFFTDPHDNDHLVAQAVATHLSQRSISSSLFNDHTNNSNNAIAASSSGVFRANAECGHRSSPALPLHLEPQDAPTQPEKSNSGETDAGTMAQDASDTVSPTSEGDSQPNFSPAADTTTTTSSEVLVPPKSVDRLQDDVQCSVCLEIQVHSHTLVPCGHSFCAPCIGIHGTGTSNLRSCPNCRQPVRQKIPSRQLDGLISTLVQVPGLLNLDDVEHYQKRMQEYQMKVEATKLKAASAKRPAKRSRTSAFRNASGEAAAQAQHVLRFERRRATERASLPRYAPDLSGALHPSISIAAATGGLGVLSVGGSGATGRTASNSTDNNNSTGSGRGRSRSGNAAAVARAAQQQAQQDFENFFRDPDLEFLRHRTGWASSVAAAPSPSAGLVSLSNSLMAAATAQQQVQQAAVASANRGYMLAAAAAAAGPGSLYASGASAANPYLPAVAQAAAAPRFLDDVSLAALLGPGGSLADSVFID